MVRQKYPKVSGATDYKKFGYVLVKPSTMPSGTVPIIIMAHGIGEAGTGSSTDLDKVQNWSGFKGFQASVDEFKFVLIHLQTNSGYGSGEIQAGIAFAKTFSFCDVNRIHYFGVSWGGYGFLRNAAVSSTFPANFATITLAAPGAYSSTNIDNNIASSGRPLWILHGNNDCVVGPGHGITLVNAVNSLGGKGWYSIWKNRTKCSGCCSPATGKCSSSQCPGCSQTTANENSCGRCQSACGAAHDMAAFLVGDSWNTPGSIYTTATTKALLPTYPLNTGKDLREISSGTLAKMGWHQWVKSNKKGTTIVPPTSVYGGVTLNNPPTANAGANQSITLPTNSVTLTGSGTDPEGQTLTYSWLKISGGTASIQSPTSFKTVVSNLQEGTYTFRLTVKDSGGATDTDDVLVTVNPEPEPPPPPVNGAPIARAGTDQTITLPTNSVTLSGSASEDPDGTIVSYAWSKTHGGTANIQSPTSATTVVSGLLEGTYTFKLRVTDNGGAAAEDWVNVTVKPALVTKTLIATFNVYSNGVVEKIN